MAKVLDCGLWSSEFELQLGYYVNLTVEGVAPSLTPLCSSYWKGSLRVALDYGRQLITALAK